MQVKMLVSTYMNESFPAGITVDVDTKTGERWIKNGIAEAVGKSVKPKKAESTE